MKAEEALRENEWMRVISKNLNSWGVKEIDDALERKSIATEEKVAALEEKRREYNKLIL